MQFNFYSQVQMSINNLQLMIYIFIGYTVGHNTQPFNRIITYIFTYVKKLEIQLLRPLRQSLCH